MQIFKKTKNGYSLVEVLIAISILMLAIVGPLTIAAKSIQTAQYARQQTTAFFLAQEGITIINTIRNEFALEAYNNAVPNHSWAWTSETGTPTASRLLPSCFTSAGCGIDTKDDSLLNNDYTCTTAQQFCRLKLRDVTNSSNSGVASLYTHAAVGVNTIVTPYTRIIRLNNVGTSELTVEVEVSWPTTYLGNATTSVVLQTSLFNIYEDL
jgi:Tfp pilus assembly protein PilV